MWWLGRIFFLWPLSSVVFVRFPSLLPRTFNLLFFVWLVKSLAWRCLCVQTPLSMPLALTSDSCSDLVAVSCVTCWHHRLLMLFLVSVSAVRAGEMLCLSSPKAGVYIPLTKEGTFQASVQNKNSGRSGRQNCITNSSRYLSSLFS